jgi:hypothetical protein
MSIVYTSCTLQILTVGKHRASHKNMYIILLMVTITIKIAVRYKNTLHIKENINAA